MSNRIPDRFATLKAENRAGLVTFVTAGDPDFDTSLEILRGLPEAGADVIELGMPFSDPMADGPAIQASSLRALRAGQNMIRTLDLVRRFRETDADTPIVLMGYYNPIYIYGNERFLKDATDAGVDGLIIVDLPPEEDEELCLPSLKAGLSFIRLATPTTNEARMERVLSHTSGFVYYVSITGITGTREVDAGDVGKHVASLRKRTDLPIAVGFGIKTPDQAAGIARVADAAVVGSAIVEQVRENLDASGRASAALSDRVLNYVRQLADGVRWARKETAAAKST